MSRSSHWPLTLYYDGDCPLCAREIRFLSRHANAQRLLLIDIGSADFQATTGGIDNAPWQTGCTPASPTVNG